MAWCNGGLYGCVQSQFYAAHGGWWLDVIDQELYPHKRALTSQHWHSIIPFCVLLYAQRDVHRIKFHQCGSYIPINIHLQASTGQALSYSVYYDMLRVMDIGSDVISMGDILIVSMALSHFVCYGMLRMMDIGSNIFNMGVISVLPKVFQAPVLRTSGSWNLPIRMKGSLVRNFNN